MSRQPLAPRDRGAVTTFAVVFTSAVLFVVGLVWDGGRMLAEQRQIDNEAAGAARAAAQAIVIDRAASQITNTIDPGLAHDRMCAYLAEVGRGCGSASLSVSGAVATVSITVTVDLPMLGLSRTLDGEARACSELGISDVIVGC